MQEYLWVKLNNVRMLVCIGVLPEEKILKNILVINLSVLLEKTEMVLDYAKVFDEVKKLSVNQYNYLEDFAKEITKALQKITHNWKSISVEIEKINPPIVGFDGSASIVYKVEKTI